MLRHHANELPDPGIGPEIPLGGRADPFRPHLDPAGVDPAAEFMVIGGREADFGRQCLPRPPPDRRRAGR